ncbi:MAG: hypothetical protein EPN25_00730 [Nitrospirae bacterium]|nr:MAG: hypothetical protein EPN25_00730 [Nitrospirota bacterium]
MSQLKAFIGHSFTDDDDDVVRAFLKFFGQVNKMNIGFSWEHAETAEPKELAEKVMRLIEDKNLFIGICTGKEAAVNQAKLRPGRFKKSVLRAEQSEFSFKTSDWIIQEIGLAKGRNMELILLVEEGVRQPGGLQGNLEYISFERLSPEKSFGKVLEMIQSLLPRAKAMIAEEGVTSSAPEEQSEPEKQGTEDWLQPKADWNRKRYELALIRTIVLDNEEGENNIKAAYLASGEGLIKKNRESWEAFHEYGRMLYGKGGKLSKLEEIAQLCTENSEVLRLLARGYQHYEDYEKAAKYFELAAEKAESASDNLSRHADAVLTLIKAGKKNDADAISENMKKLAGIEEGEEHIISLFRKIAETEDDIDLSFGLTERLLQLRPDETDARFKLAYSYSQANQNAAALFHYLKIPYHERNAMTWNNLGAGFDHFDLVRKSVEAYKKAEDLGETLAMSNLASKLIKAGFLHEAEELCNKAIKIEDYHKNVSYAVSRIKDIPEEEDVKEKETLDKVLPLSEFYRDYGHALVQVNHSDHEGRWQGPDCVLNVSIVKKRFIAEGHYEQRSALGLSFYDNYLRRGMPDKTQKTKKFKINYEGIVSGRSVKCICTQRAVEEVSAVPALLGDVNKSVEVLLIISHDLKEIRACEKGDSLQHKYYSLRRID